MAGYKRKRTGGYGGTRKKKVFRSRRKKVYARKRPQTFNAASPMKAGKLMKFKYVETRLINPGATGVADYIFSANGMFDPNISGVGHQPLGFDQWCPVFFNHYTVVGSKITARFATQGEGVLPNTIVAGIDLRDDSTAVSATSVDAMLEHPRSNGRIITNAHGSRGAAIVSKGFSAKKFFRRTSPVDDNELRGNSSANPAEQAYYHVWLGAADPNTNPDAVTVIVTIEYSAVMTEPNDLTQS